MPQAPRKDITTKAQDKESKRARGALSCAECRRLKLKCDKTVPCSSCKRRGCSAICPNGSLITGQGTRFVLADTEKLHQKIAYMSDRIRQLEDALAVLQSTVSGPSGEPHPLLHRDLLKIKSSIDLHSASDGASMFPSGSGTLEEATEVDEGDDDEHEPYIDAFGTLAIRDDGAATFYGRSAGSESLLIGEEHSAPERFPSATSSYSDLHSNDSRQFGYPYHPGEPSSSTTLPQGIANLASSFPLASSLSLPMSATPTLASSSSLSSPSSLSYPCLPHFQGSITLQTLITQYLPPYPEAIRLTQLYLEQAPWFFGAVTGRELESEILPMWYGEASSASTPPSSSGLSAIDGTAESGQQRVGTSHDLALLFVVFCFGNMADINLPAPPTNIPAERFYHLTKAALTLDSASVVGNDTKAARNGLLDRPPSVATVQALSLMAIYEGICSGENSIESTWTLMGLAGKLAQSIGLHRDCARWKLSTQEVQKRRALFWELFITDCWQSLATGRLATFSLPFVDCELPFDHDQIISDDGSAHPSFPFWKARFGAECVAAVVQGTLTSRAPRYSIILDLDRKVRDMELPIYAQGVPPQGLGLAQTMSHFMPHNYRELTLLYIHRCFFAHALSSNPLDPIKSQYAPSFLAGYRSACTIVASVKTQFSMFPKQIARFWVLWTHAFSASVMLASVVTHASRSKIAPAALLELKNACDLFQQASPHGGRAGKFLPILKRLQAKAQKVYRDANSGTPAPIPNDIFKPSQAGEAKDELSIFSGQTHTVNTKATPSTHGQSPNATPPSTSRSPSTQGRSASDSPSQVFTDNPSFAGVHPSLVSELNMFQGHIRAQIQNAYRAGGEVFGAGPMDIDSAPLPAPQQQHLPQHQVQMVPQQERQQQQQQQHRYELQAIERERKDAEQREIQRQQMEQAEMERQRIERQEFERQEMARMKQELERQKQQEVHRHQQHEQQAHQARMQQQSDAQRHQEKLEQQRNQEHYHRQLEIQQQQEQQIAQYRSQPQYERDAQFQPPYAVGPDRPNVAVIPHANAPVAQPSHQRNPSHPQPPTNLHRSYPQQQYQPMPHPQGPPHPHSQPMGPPPPPHAHAHPPYPPQHHDYSVGALTPQHTGSSQHHSSQPSQQQHSLYVRPHSQEYAAPRSNASYIDYTPPTTSYGPPLRQDAPEAYKYWPAASGSFAMPVQQPSSSFAPPAGQHYTPEGALRGIAADDRSLQETWRSYMNNVGSPRQFFGD